jgi:hypothetical protein
MRKYLVLKYVAPILIAILTIIGVFMLTSIKPPTTNISTTQTTTIQKVSRESFCDLFMLEARETCKNSTKKCSGMPHDMGFWSCVAIELIRSSVSSAQQACKQLENLDDQKFCFADALDEINITAAKEQCNLINYTDAKIICLANIFKKTNLTEALKSCEEFGNTAKMYICKALVTTPHSKDEAMAYCEKISDKEMKITCINIVKY